MRTVKASHGEIESNAQAAWIILDDPGRYAGLPLLWAELWVSCHGPASKPVDQDTKSLHAQLAARDFLKPLVAKYGNQPAGELIRLWKAQQGGAMGAGAR
jgi:hypothetical protein